MGVSTFRYAHKQRWLEYETNVATLVAPARWETDYRDHYARLRAILDQNATNAEIGDARRHVTDADREVVTALIGRNLDA